MLGLDPQVPCYRSSPVLRTSTILLRLLGHQSLWYLILSAENTAQSQELGSLWLRLMCGDRQAGSRELALYPGRLKQKPYLLWHLDIGKLQG